MDKSQFLYHWIKAQDNKILEKYQANANQL